MLSRQSRSTIRVQWGPCRPAGRDLDGKIRVNRRVEDSLKLIVGKIMMKQKLQDGGVPGLVQCQLFYGTDGILVNVGIIDEGTPFRILRRDLIRRGELHLPIVFLPISDDAALIHLGT